MAEGWIKLHRPLLDKPIWQNQNIFRTWLYCLLKAHHKPVIAVIGLTKVPLKPGQFVFGRFEASKETGIRPSTLVSCMSWLKLNNSLDIKSTNKYSIVTVVNWALYQSGEIDSDTKSDTNSDTCPTPIRQQTDTYNNLENVKKYSLVRDLHLRLAEFLKERITAWKPNAKFPKDLHKWADCVRLCMEADGRSEAEIEEVIEWATADSFWQGNILSAEALRRNFDKLQARMNQANPKPSMTDWSRVK